MITFHLNAQCNVFKTLEILITGQTYQLYMYIFIMNVVLI